MVCADRGHTGRCYRTAVRVGERVEARRSRDRAVREVLDALVAEPIVSLALVANDLSEVQRARRARLARLELGRYL